MDVIFTLLLGGIGIATVVAVMVIVGKEKEDHEEHYIPTAKTDTKTSQNE